MRHALLDGAPQDQAAVPSCEDAGQKDTDKNTGKRLVALKVDLQSGCCSACLTTAGCDTWVFATDAGSQGNNCWLMNGVQSTKSAPNRVRGWAASQLQRMRGWSESLLKCDPKTNGACPHV